MPAPPPAFSLRHIATMPAEPAPPKVFSALLLRRDGFAIAHSCATFVCRRHADTLTISRHYFAAMPSVSPILPVLRRFSASAAADIFFDIADDTRFRCFRCRYFRQRHYLRATLFRYFFQLSLSPGGQAHSRHFDAPAADEADIDAGGLAASQPPAAAISFFIADRYCRRHCRQPAAVADAFA
jgi:hypothetical protein